MGNTTDKKIVDTFFTALTANHSYATGGSSSGECWQSARDLGNFLTDQTEESCTQYNALKIARSSFQASGDPKLADFYELAIWNGIIGNQKREATGSTSFIYMLPLGGVNMKPWGKSDFGFPCCWGTLSESFSKLGDSIFFARVDDSALYINQFVSATVKWGAVTVEQIAFFPNDVFKTSAITFHLPASSLQFSVMLRVPGWAVSSNVVYVNGVSVADNIISGTYLNVTRSWTDGDVLSFYFPLSLWTNPLNDRHAVHNATLAFMVFALIYPVPQKKIFSHLIRARVFFVGFFFVFFFFVGFFFFFCSFVALCFHSYALRLFV